MNTQTEANINELAGDVHLLTAPIRFLFRCVLALVFLLLAPLLYAAVPFDSSRLILTAISRFSLWRTWLWVRSHQHFG